MDFMKIVDKIKKLLALATSPNEHEAQAAAAKAHALLVQHNLDLQEVKDRPPLEYVEVGVEKRIFQRTEEKFVAWILEEHFFVKWLQQKNPGENWAKNASISTWYDRTTKLVGTKANVEIAIYVRQFLIDKFNQLWIEYRSKNELAPRYQQSYYRGLYEGLDRKLKDQKRRIENERGLVLVKDPMLDQLTKDAKAGGSVNYNSGLSQWVIQEGIEDGKKIEIQKSLKAEPTKTGKTLMLEDSRRKR